MSPRRYYKSVLMFLIVSAICMTLLAIYIIWILITAMMLSIS